MTYQHGQSNLKPATVAKTTNEIRTELSNLNRIRAEIQAESAERAKELERIKAARKQFARRRLKPVPTYAPLAETLAYQEQHAEIIASQPEPEHGGPSGLLRAMREAQEHEERKRRGGVNARAGREGSTALGEARR